MLSVRPFARSLARSLARTFVRSFVRSFDPSACARVQTLSIALKRAAEQPAAPSRLSDAGSHPVTCLLLENVGQTRAGARARAHERITNWTGVTFPR